MDSLINRINSAVGLGDGGRIEQNVSVVDAVATRTIQQVGVGKLGYSPVPVPFPKTTLTYNQTHWVLPMGIAKISQPDDVFWLPTDPQISISGSNSIVKREIASGNIRGTVKELWRNDDWSIEIAGIIMTDDNGTMEDYIKRLVELVSAREALIVTCDIINNHYGITRLVVTSFSFPATDGTENQTFTISAVSDDSYTLEVE